MLVQNDGRAYNFRKKGICTGLTEVIAIFLESSKIFEGFLENCLFAVFRKRVVKYLFNICLKVGGIALRSLYYLGWLRF